MDDHDPFSDLSAGTSLEDEESLEGVCLSFRPIYKAAPDGAAVECILKFIGSIHFGGCLSVYFGSCQLSN